MAKRPAFDHCKSCGAEIYWLRTERGKWVPLDAVPVPDGNVIVGDDGTARYVARHAAELPPDVPRYVSHFSSCPQAQEWRKR